MLKARLVLILGIWVALLPYLGFPFFIKNILFVITGFIFIYISFVIYKEIKIDDKANIFDNFSESEHFDKN